MDELDEVLKFQEEAKKIVDKMKMNYLLKEDILVCNYVYKQLDNIYVSDINYGKVISQDEMKEKSLGEMKIFGKDNEKKVFDLLSKTPIIHDFNEVGQFGTVVSYAYDNDDLVIPDSGIISKYLIPSKLNELSIYNFAHEHIHAMKDTNYSEYKNAMTL